jgi:formylglycine-generating enzyme required for sulfatase activity
MRKILALLMLFSMLAIGCSRALESQDPTEPSLPTETLEPSLTVAPTLTPTFTFIPTSYSFTTWTRPADGMVMVFVPEGISSMGSTAGDPSESPPHSVYLDAYWIDRTEVTNEMYHLCVEAGVCRLPSENSSNTDGSYYDRPAYADFPVIYVDWNAAAAYCAWVKGRLPTEAEWEKAARGTDGRTYPWGNSAPTCSLANYNGCRGDTSMVSSYLSGVSPFGALDLAGNVGEWVADWFGFYLGSGRLVDNPIGPDTGDARVFRGGSWNSDDDSLRSFKRSWVPPTVSSYNIGFRCSQSP